MQTIKTRVRYKPAISFDGRCPHCGGPAPTQNYVTVLADDNLAYIGDREINLTKNLAIVLEAFVDAYPRVVTRNFLSERIYGGLDNPADDKIYDVWICQLRKCMTGTAASLKTVWRRGWRLEIEERR